MRSLWPVTFVWVCLVLLSTKTLLAQAELDCVTLSDQALTEFATNCRDFSSGMLCYGHKLVSVETNSVQANAFLNGSDQIALSSVAKIQGSPLNPSTGDWGLALASLLPTDATADIKLILMGDAAFSLTPSVPTGIQVSNSFDSVACAEAPNIVAISASPDVVATVKLNGVDVQVTALVVLQQESTNAFKAIVYTGTMSINNGATVQTGQTIAGVMDNLGTILFWSAPRTSTDSELRTAGIAAEAFARFGLAQPTPPPELAPIPTNTPEPASANCGSGVTHVVQPGENLFRIALRYNTTIDTIVQANGIADMNQIVVGTTLIIPCGIDNGTSSVAPGTETTDIQPTVEPDAAAEVPPTIPGKGMTIDCGGFNGQLPPNAPPEFQELFNQFCQ